MGAEAVMALIDADEETAAMVIALDGNQIVRKRLMPCVERVHICYYYILLLLLLYVLLSW